MSTKKLSKLTDEQVKSLPTYVDKWVKIGLSTTTIDFDKSVECIKEIYKIGGLTPPKFFIGPVNGPYEGAVVEQILKDFLTKKVEFKSDTDLNKKVLVELDNRIKRGVDSKISLSNQVYGFQEYWLSYYDFFKTECKLEMLDISSYIELSKNCGWWTPLANIAIIQHKPLAIHRDDRNRLHNPTGPSVYYRCNTDGSESKNNVYAVHGVRVKKSVIDKQFSVEDIDSEQNVEIRRVMIDVYGADKYILDSKATLVHQDDFGTLYSKPLNGDEPLMMVKVVNSTEEPDGTFKDYWLRVDPKAYGGIKTAHAAVASTWRNKSDKNKMKFDKPEDYYCDIQT